MNSYPDYTAPYTLRKNQHNPIMEAWVAEQNALLPQPEANLEDVAWAHFQADMAKFPNLPDATLYGLWEMRRFIHSAKLTPEEYETYERMQRQIVDELHFRECQKGERDQIINTLQQ